ncbi:MAG: ATP-binding protein [Myxococcaceae bacterium]|nr:ATP-binding protein [Myxococcaceae bacterium]
MVIPRVARRDRILRELRRSPVVALLGPRQVGKTTLAREVADRWSGDTHHFDLELPSAVARLAEPELALAPLRGLVVLDEVQRRPALFPVLRVLADRPKKPARFLVLGSASAELLRQESETLAGRVSFIEIDGFSLDEVGAARLDRLWLRGGFPRSYAAGSDADSAQWRSDFVRTFLERDLAQLGVKVPAPTLRRFWTMLAHVHGQVLNWSALGRSMGVSDATVRRYADALEAALVVTQLKPWHENISKRQVKAPKLYLRDCGLLHTLLGIDTAGQLDVSPQSGASWEGFLIGQVLRVLGVDAHDAFFWATHQGAELDLLVHQRGRRLGFEFKRTAAPSITSSMRSALESLSLDSLTVVHAGPQTFSLGTKVRAVAASRLVSDLS